ncbi:MAG: hypothetical protein WC791_04320 [Candidatus Paceibacterota bacterium]|jgi:hypothetical protein
MEKKKIARLEKLLKEHIAFLSGSFVSRDSGYDGDICKIIDGFEETTTRYWDCFWKEESLYIEFKKGKSIWLDLVRYSEIILGENSDSKIQTFTLFFIPNNARTEIIEIIGLETRKLINKINLGENEAVQLLLLNKTAPRSFNAQASLTVKDIRQIADFIVKSDITS